MFSGEVRLPFINRKSLRSLAFVPIAGYVGYNGMGKSLAATAAAMVHLEMGRPVLSTSRLLDYTDPRPCEDERCTWINHGEPGHMQAHPGWIPLDDYSLFFSAVDCHILMDEVTGVADAREHMGMPVQVANFLPQLRRKNVTMAWTTIDWAFADIRIRRVTLAAIHCAGLRPVYSGDALWPRNRTFLFRAYDAKAFDEFQAHKKEQAKPVARVWFNRVGSAVERAYDSGDAVLTLGAVNEAGLCMDCGGRRSAPRCECKRKAKAVPARTAQREDGDDLAAAAPAPGAGSAPS